MPDDVLPFLGGMALFVLYLLWSAATEMGTRWPGPRAGQGKADQSSQKKG